MKGDKMGSKKLLALALVAGLAVGSIGAAEAGKKKKKKKKPKLVAQTSVFYLRNLSECDLENMTLSVTDGEDTDCYSQTNPAGAVIGYTPYVYSAADGLPLILDAAKPLTGTIAIRSGNSVGVGMGSVDLLFTGESGGKEVEIGKWSSEDFPVIPATVETLEYEIDVDDALNKKTFTSFKLTVTPQGVTTGFYGTVEHDDPLSLINVPAYVKKK